MNRNFCCSPRVASHNSRSCADCLKMHPGVTQVQTPKTEQIIHDACEVQVDIFSSFKVRLLQLEHEARRRRAGFETISLPLPSYIIKKMSGWARQLRRVLPQANTPVARCECYQMWHFEAKTETRSPTCEAQFKARDGRLLLFSWSFPARPSLWYYRVLWKPKLNTSSTACLSYKRAFLMFLNNSRISVSLISTASFQVFICQSCLF